MLASIQKFGGDKLISQQLQANAVVRWLFLVGLAAPGARVNNQAAFSILAFSAITLRTEFVFHSKHRHRPSPGVKYRLQSKASAMDKRELDRYKRALLEKREELAVGNAGSLVPAAGGWEGDPVDQANADAEADLQIRLHQSNGRLLRAVDGALSRIKHGTFGVCESCQKPILRARLEAVPWTRHCRDCKERTHAA